MYDSRLHLVKRLFIWIVLFPLIKSSESNVDRCPYMEIQHNTFKGQKVIGPLDLVRNVMPKAGKNMEPFIELKLMLETIADDSNLYDAPEDERIKTIENLLQQPRVKKIIEECEVRHVQPSCNASSPYRSLDGTCNNLKHPMWGSTFSEQIRLLPPAYEGSRDFRKSVNGSDLPAARTISLKMKDENHSSTQLSALFSFFGQFVAHDMVMTPVFTRNNEFYSCCEPSERDNFRCAPIYYPKDDPFYSKLNVDCQNFIRSIPFPQCNFEKRTPVAKVNSFLDMSTLYGNDEEEDETLRRYDNAGRMKTRSSSFGPILCQNEIEDEVFCPHNMTDICFRSGDHRVNMHSMLTALHTMFVRFHNIIAENFLLLNEHWNAEKTFQEVRRVVTAVLQRIAYDEYLPFLIGRELMEKYNLNLDESLYNDEANPTLIVEFAAAAFRLHSMVPKNITSSYPDLKLADTFSNLKPVYEGQSDCLITGSSELPSQKNDRFFIGDLSHDLYKPPGATYGFDQTSMNVHRGRDLGLQPYVEVLKYLSKEEINSFDDLKKTIPEEGVDFLKNIYDFPADIDTYVGFLMEKHLPDLDIGPSAAEIIAKQFYGTKFGDSFFFTHTNGRYPFTTDQMKSIKDFSLSQIICLATNAVEVRRYPLLLPDEIKNPLIPCSSIQAMHLNPWLDQPSK